MQYIIKYELYEKLNPGPFNWHLYIWCTYVLTHKTHVPAGEDNNVASVLCPINFTWHDIKYV